MQQRRMLRSSRPDRRRKRFELADQRVDESVVRIEPQAEQPLQLVLAMGGRGGRRR